ncbi:hypothetical protein TWF132_005797 [Orbilia oligospora]|nr:hypothetical protein TWF132_005797 [Orbilia oligospora]
MDEGMRGYSVRFRQLLFGHDITSRLSKRLAKINRSLCFLIENNKGNSEESKNNCEEKQVQAVYSWRCLTTETVEGTSLTLEGIDDIEGGNGLSLGVLTV